MHEVVIAISILVLLWFMGHVIESLDGDDIFALGTTVRTTAHPLLQAGDRCLLGGDYVTITHVDSATATYTYAPRTALDAS